MRPTGRHLICKNVDKPGFIGSIGTLLGDAGVNISDMTVGLKEGENTAITVVAVGEKLDDSILEKVKSLDLLEKFCLVNLDK